jgi:hypothetical protein
MAHDAAEIEHPAIAAPTAENPRHAELQFTEWEPDRITEVSVQLLLNAVWVPTPPSLSRPLGE